MYSVILEVLTHLVQIQYGSVDAEVREYWEIWVSSSLLLPFLSLCFSIIM